MLKSNSAIFPNSAVDNSGFSGLTVPMVKSIQDHMVIYSVTMFGADLSIFEDARM